MRQSFILMPILCLLAACQSAKGDPWEKAGISSDLGRVSVEIRDEMRLLAKTQSALAEDEITDDQAAQRFFQATYVPPGFETLVDFDFVGDAERAARRIAEYADYRFEAAPSLGRQVIWVNLHVRKAPLNDALRELGAQTGHAAKVEVYPGSRLLRFIPAALERH